MPALSRVLSEHECAVVFQSAHERQVVHGPGSVRTFGRSKRVVVVDLRPFVVELALTDVLTKDGVGVSVSATLDGRIIDPEAAVVEVVDYMKAMRIIAETAIRGVVKEWDSAERESASTSLEAALVEIVVPAAQGWGVAISASSVTVEWPSGD